MIYTDFKFFTDRSETGKRFLLLRANFLTQQGLNYYLWENNMFEFIDKNKNILIQITFEDFNKGEIMFGENIDNPMPIRFSNEEEFNKIIFND